MQQVAGSRGGIFLAGLFFMSWVAFVCVQPRMPSDLKNGCEIGGRLSSPFRRALLGLVLLATLRLIILKLLDTWLLHFAILEGILVTAFNVGLSFLCMTTSYLLQCQLTHVINIQPGLNLMPYLIVVFVMTVTGITAAHVSNPNFSALVSLAGAVSSIPVIQTLQLYARVTTRGGNQEGRGNVMTQTLLATEYYYVFSCMVAFLAEAFYRGPNIAEDEYLWTDGLIHEMRHHQDIGVDDWTRLLVHSIFLNLIDELTHICTTASSSSDDAEDNNAPSSSTSEYATKFDAVGEIHKQHHDEEQEVQLVTKTMTSTSARNRR